MTVVNDSHTHAFNNLTSKTGGTGTYYTSGVMAGATLIGGTSTALTGAGQLGLLANDPYIAFYPASSTTRNGYLQKINSGDYFFFGEESYVRCDSSFRAPIFYDQNNTGYYTNPASTSVLNQLRLDSTAAAQLYTGNTYLNVRYGSTGAGGIRLYDSGDVLQGYWYGSGAGEHGFLDNDGSWAVRVRTGTNPLQLSCNGNDEYCNNTETNKEQQIP